MCGFCLAVDDASVDIHSLTESIKHRGPDSTRYFLGDRIQCGFNRLSIVDSDHRSDQPMLDSSERYLLAFNGEIYNHNELRSGLEERHGINFKTRSDTEVLLYGLIHEGAEFVARLDGIFAFAFVDLKSLEICLGRDIFGVKPLFYYLRGGQLYVSSELKPLWQLSGSSLHFSNVARYLSYGTVANGGTIVSGINELELNSIKWFCSGRETKTRKIRDFVYDVNDNVSMDEISNVLYRTVDSQKPEIPYGVLFSGGLDSTLILDRSFKDDRFLGAYSVDVDHPDMSETRWQEYAVKALNIASKYHKVTLRKDDLSIESIRKIARDLDHPLFHPNFLGSFLLTRRAADDGLKVLLSGEGADELFLGYRWFFADQQPSEFLEYIPLQDLAALWGMSGVEPVQTAGMSRLEVFQKVYLRRWLARQDLTGMANSIEVRVPFLGLDLAILANELSMKAKRGNGEHKWIIKELLSQKFPEEFVKRKKIGFDFPLNDWIGDEHVALLRERTDLFDAAGLDSILAKYKGSNMRNRIVFSLVSFSAWHDSIGKFPAR